MDGKPYTLATVEGCPVSKKFPKLRPLPDSGANAQRDLQYNSMKATMDMLWAFPDKTLSTEAMLRQQIQTDERVKTEESAFKGFTTIGKTPKTWQGMQ